MGIQRQHRWLLLPNFHFLVLGEVAAEALHGDFPAPRLCFAPRAHHVGVVLVGDEIVRAIDPATLRPLAQPVEPLFRALHSARRAVDEDERRLISSLGNLEVGLQLSQTLLVDCLLALARVQLAPATLAPV